jgi:hypothetical protein
MLLPFLTQIQPHSSHNTGSLEDESTQKLTASGMQVMRLFRSDNLLKKTLHFASREEVARRRWGAGHIRIAGRP